MARKPYDPLAFVPSPDAIRETLRETQTLAERLKLLLELAERLRLPLAPASEFDRGAGGEGVRHVR